MIVLHLTTSINIDCRYIIADWGSVLGTIYWCSVQNDPSIKFREESIITSVSGTHSFGKSNDDLRVFYINSKTVNYFPKGIEKTFKNLQGIELTNSSLQEITQSDVSVFPELVVLYLGFNCLQVLEQGLFDFNPKLKIINLFRNKISQIYPNVFDNLKQLFTLHLDENTCINTYAYRNATEVQSVIQQVKLSCPYIPSRMTPLTSTMTQAPEIIECPSSCTSEMLKLSRNFNIFRKNCTKRFKEIDEVIRSLMPVNVESQVDIQYQI